MNILHVNVFDVYGGGETIMRRLCEGAVSKGHQPQILVREKMAEDLPFPVSVFEHESKRTPWARAWRSLGSDLMAGPGRDRKWMRGVARFLMGPVAEPRRQWQLSAGREDFIYPDTFAAMQRIEPEPDVIHIHCFHGKYFDLKELESISRWRPTIVTLHDAWMFTGHCAYPGSCLRFVSGCGQCPDLGRYPAIPRDATAVNFKHKKQIYSRSALFMAAPSQWMMDQLNMSAMGGCFHRQQVIPNGIDTGFFSPDSPVEARLQWNLPEDRVVLLYVARNARSSPYKDYPTVLEAARQVAHSQERRVHLLVLGDEGTGVKEENLSVQFALTTESEQIRSAYRACDLYLHAAQAENFPTTILEAMACGCPVVATRTGGIQEQVEDGKTGFLVNPGDAKTMAKSIVTLLEDPARRKLMGEAGRFRAANAFDQSIMTEQYLAWYQLAVDQHTQALKELD